MKIRGFSHFGSLVHLTVLMGWVLSLSACSVSGKLPLGQSPTPLPTVVLGGEAEANPPAAAAPTASKGGVVASAVAAPAQQTQLAFALSGRVAAVKIAEGDHVKAGQTLAALDATDAQLAVTQAEADVAIAQANLELGQATEPARIAANVAAAKLALLEAQSALDELKRNAPLEAAQAQMAVANALESLDQAQRNRTNMDYPRADQTTIEAAQANYDLKNDELQEAQDAYEHVKDRPADDPQRAQALLNLTNAQKERDKALAALNWYLGKNSDLDLAKADAQLALAQAQLAAAQSHWDEVKEGPSTQAVALAEARLASAQAQLDLAQAQPTSEPLAQAQLEAARARLAVAQAQLDKMTITAPFDGVVTALNVHAGEWVLVGQAVVVVADVDHLRIVTTDLSERDIPKVTLGQRVTVTFKALSQEAVGMVSAISPLADTLGGDVVYKVTIELDALPAGLRAGMSAEVQFEAGP